jgi:hypothetical protein
MIGNINNATGDFKCELHTSTSLALDGHQKQLVDAICSELQYLLTGLTSNKSLSSFVASNVLQANSLKSTQKWMPRKPQPNRPQGAQAPSFNLKGELK